MPVKDARPLGRPRLGGDRPLLSREDVVAAAVGLTRRGGLASVTVQGVADALGVSAPAIYHWVRSRDALRDLVLADVVGGIDATSPDGPPLDRLRALLLATRARLRAHPGVAEHWITRRQPPAAGLPTSERALTALLDAGLSPRDAVRTFTALYTYTMGHLMLPSPDAPLRAGRRRRREGGLAQAYAELADLDADEEFRYGLDLLLAAATRRPPEPVTDP